MEHTQPGMQHTQPYPTLPFEKRPCGPRTYRPIRHRNRAWSALDNKRPPVWRKEAMAMADEIPEDPLHVDHENKTNADNGEEFLDRETLCLPHFKKDVIVHGGDDGFQDVLRRYFPSAENSAAEKLVTLKAQLKAAETHAFWSLLMEGMCDTMGAQCGFVAKRMLVDDQDSAVEMPPLGEPGSCLMGVAFYVNDGREKKLSRDYRYNAYGTPCAHMRYDKVFIVPERMSEFFRDNPNKKPWDKSEAFIGVPLFIDGKSIGHFGMIWSEEGAETRPKCSWSFIEMFLHSLEDMILERLLSGQGFVKSVEPLESTAEVIPLVAITASQSLKPYARSLSHELRTPMQGVIGILDIMYSTVVDAIGAQQSEKVKSVFEDLKSHIEVVQDSSRRAVEAADNVVHAYDLNMQMPETLLTPNQPEKRKRLPIFDALFTSPKRKRIRSEEPERQVGPLSKWRRTTAEPEGSRRSSDSQPIETPPSASPEIAPEIAFSIQSSSDNGTLGDMIVDGPSPMMSPALLTPPLHQIDTRDFIRSIVHQALRNTHPIKEVHQDTELGEIIEVQTFNTRGDLQTRTISIEIDTPAPSSIMTSSQHLQFALLKLVDNSIKFTEHGRIQIAVKLADEVLEIWVVDSGCGIAEEAKKRVFTPHFQEDARVCRWRDGLGLSLFNAKAQVRQSLGGDLTLERSDTEGPLRGSEFLIRLPLSNLENDASSLTPLVGTSILSAYANHTFMPLTPSESALPSSPNLLPPLSPLPLTLDLTPKRKSQNINRNLAKYYPLNILIAEDNPTNRNIFLGALKRLGYASKDITVAFDGLEAVEKYEARLEDGMRRDFDVVFMDIWMPRMDGYAATREILEMAGKGAGLGYERVKEVKVIAVTADITAECAEKAKSVGMRAVLRKPYKVVDVEALIMEHFDRCC